MNTRDNNNCGNVVKLRGEKNACNGSSMSLKEESKTQESEGCCATMRLRECVHAVNDKQAA